MGKELLLEIGTEEIPAAFLPGAMSELKALTEKVFAEQRLGFSLVQTFATPRRLILYAEGLPEKQEDLDRTVLGPARSVAYDSDGNPTKAAIGFARGQSVDVKDLTLQQTPKGEYISAVKKESGLPATEVLQKILPEIITTLHFPKSMRWGSGSLRFARPIHWILAMYNEEVIPFEFDGIKSGNLSRGHRFMSPGSCTVHSFKSYKASSRDRFLMFDPEERKKEILKQIQKIEVEVGGSVIQDEKLLEEVVYLVEYPTVLCGSFEPGFLSLPRPVLITAMREHQRYFSLESSSGDLLPHFITVSNTRARDAGMIISGNERVLRARLTDALYFYKTDCGRPFSSYMEDLKRVTFQEKLGTLFEKVERIAALSAWLAKKTGIADTVPVSTAASLCKADLCTSMVREFPALQGEMGREYALLSGESEQVARAVSEHYRPRFAGDLIPSTDEGALVSLADKMDTIAGCFGVGLIPSGSEDPYALRRQTLGILAILLEKGYPLALTEMIDEALRLNSVKISPDLEGTRKTILDYFKGRLSGLLISDAHRYDTVEAVLGAGFDHIPDTMARMDALTAFRGEPLFEPFTVVCKRAMNIIKGIETAKVQKGLLQHESEIALYQKVQQTEKKVNALIQKGKYGEALTTIASLRDAIDAFFDGVMVMDKDENIKENRQALLSRVAGLVSRIADFSKIVVE
ncbi:MAG: glycine--tRNA ligase subunit beta [bacterium]